MPHPDSSAVQIGAFEVAITLVFETSMPQVSKQCEVIHSIIAYRTMTNQVDYVIDASSAEFDPNGDDEAIDNNSAARLYELVSVAVVEEGVNRSLTACPTCIAPATARVYVEACISRSNSGVATVIAACSGTTMGYRDLSVCSSLGPSQPQITVVSRSGGTCSGGCDETCIAP